MPTILIIGLTVATTILHRKAQFAKFNKTRIVNERQPSKPKKRKKKPPKIVYEGADKEKPVGEDTKRAKTSLLEHKIEDSFFSSEDDEKQNFESINAGLIDEENQVRSFQKKNSGGKG